MLLDVPDDIQPDIWPQVYVVSERNPVSNGTTNLTTVIDRVAATESRKWEGQTDPVSMKFRACFTQRKKQALVFQFLKFGHLTTSSYVVALRRRSNISRSWVRSFGEKY